MRFVHAADVHLDSPLSGLDRYEGAPVEAFRLATRRALENLVGLCVAEGARLLVVAGDLYDGDWPDYNTGLFFARQMARLDEAGVPVVIARGNHDAASEITRALRLPPNVRVLPAEAPATLRFDEIGVAVHGQSFAARKVTEDLARGYPDPIPGVLNVGVLHTSLDGREGHEPYAPTTADALARKGYDYWALGHVHAREVVRERPWIVFPGNLQGRHARETGAKGATLVTVEDGRVARVEHRAVDAVRWAACDVDASRAIDRDEVLDRVEAALGRAASEADGRPVAARVRAFGRTAAHAALRGDQERFEADVRALAGRARGLWVEKVLVQTEAEADRAAGSAAAAVLSAEVARLREPGALAAVLAPIREKLPAEVRDVARDEAALLADAEALLALRLYAEEP